MEGSSRLSHQGAVSDRAWGEHQRPWVKRCGILTSLLPELAP